MNLIKLLQFTTGYVIIYWLPDVELKNKNVFVTVRPLFVEILAREQPLSVGQAAELACKAVGARPPAVITWWLDDREMPAGSAIQKVCIFMKVLYSLWFQNQF